MVQEALAKKPALIATTDLLARRFVQGLLALAVVTGAMWIDRGPAIAFERVVALLVVACPCAIGLSIPLALSVALMRAARSGIFVKNPDALERLRHTGTVLLDKTGTLTEGRATVARWHGEDGALQFARALEAESAHAVARAFQRSFGRPMWLVQDRRAGRRGGGAGIEGRLDGHDVRVGNRAHVESAGAAVPADTAAAAEAMIADGLSPVFVAIDGLVRGVAGIGDRLRGDAGRTVAALITRGIRVRILSGDHPGVVARVAGELGLPVDDALGGLSPEDKRDIVAQLVGRSRGPSGPAGTGGSEGPPPRGSVVMVGDGVNDSAALALADVGIAVHGGAGATIVASDVVLTREGVAPLVELLDGARQLRGVIRRNLVFSVLYNGVAATFAMMGLVGPLAAAVLMPLSSLTVVASSAFTRTFAASPARGPRPAAGGGVTRDTAEGRWPNAESRPSEGEE